MAPSCHLVLLITQGAQVCCRPCPPLLGESRRRSKALSSEKKHRTPSPQSCTRDGDQSRADSPTPFKQPLGRRLTLLTRMSVASKCLPYILGDSPGMGSILTQTSCPFFATSTCLWFISILVTIPMSTNCKIRTETTL